MIHWQIQRRCLSNDWNRSLAWLDHTVETAYRTGRWGTDAGPWQTGSVTLRVRTSVNTKHQIGKHRYISIENTGIFINNDLKKKPVRKYRRQLKHRNYNGLEITQWSYCSFGVYWKVLYLLFGHNWYLNSLYVKAQRKVVDCASSYSQSIYFDELMVRIGFHLFQ